ncbi:MAG: DNA (cytosine-5-)-methyltransferase [Bacteroidota bacterium]
MKTIKHIELFAGIGGFRRAIDLIAKDLGYLSQCVGFSEVDKYASTSYKNNYDVSGEVEMGDILKFIEKRENIKQIGDFDLLTGGFPCQAFSMMGKKLGFEDERGNLFYSIVEILKIKQPKYVLLENVRNLKTHDKGRTYKEIVRSLEEEAGYLVSSDIFNTSDFGLPQHRRRIFIFAKRRDLCDNLSVPFSAEYVKMFSRKLNGSTSLFRYKSVIDGILDKEVERKYYLSERIKPTILANGSKNFKSKSEINQLIARPLTATMVKMHRACQDNYYSKEFLTHKSPKEYLRQNFSKEELRHHQIRKLTPWEALKLQGFDYLFYKNAAEAGVSNHQLYKQAGNAVSVNTVYAIINYLMTQNIIDFD